MAFSQGRPHVALRSQGGQYGSLHVNKNPLHDPRVKPAAFSRYSLFGLVVVLLGAAACMGAVVLKSHSAYRNYLEDYSVNDLADARSILHSLNIMAKRRDGSYAPPSSSLLDAYNIDLLVEPDVEMHLELERCSNDFIDCADVSWSASPIDQDIIGEVAFDAKSKGPSVVMTFRMANSKFNVQALHGSLVLASAEVSVKYVRRDLYSLTKEHREQYFAAMQTLFTTSQAEGEALYGKYFFSHGEMANLHDADFESYHDNLFFLTSHPTMQLKVERALLAIDPTVSLPYWDFLLDTKLGKEWASSRIYDEDWFGPVATLESNNFRITGRFSNVTNIYDPGSIAYPHAHHDGFGFLGGSHNTDFDMHLQRSNSYCGFRSIQGQSTCGHVATCFKEFENSSDLYDWDICLEEKVHGNLHTMHAGQWDCSVDWQAWFSENNDWMDPLFFSILGLNAERGTGIFVKKGYVTCPSSSSCQVGETCACTSALSNVTSASDVDNLSFGYIFHKMQFFWTFVGERVLQGSDWVVYHGTYHNYSGVYIPLDRDKEVLSLANLDALNRLLMKTILFMGKVGHMVSGAASSDPLFWVMHQFFDKALHALVLSPRYNKNGFTWNNADGKLEWRGANGTTSFKAEAFEPWLGKTALAKATNAKSGDFLTNEDLWALLHPHSDAIPYVYDQMTTWGDCTFDPFK